MRFNELHTQLTHLYERLNKNPETDYCLAYKMEQENVTAFVVKQVNFN